MLLPGPERERGYSINRRPPLSGVAQEIETAKTSTQSRSKKAAQRRPAPRPSRGEGFPVLPVAVGAALVAVVLGFVIYAVVSSGKSQATPQTVAQQYGCSGAEMLTQTHFHTHLDVWVNGGPGVGVQAPIPAFIGIQSDASGATTFCWIHTHDTSGIIHVEAPTARAAQGFHLSDFLKVWRLTNPDATLSASAGQKEVVYVDGKRVNESATNVPLKSLEWVTVEIMADNQSPTPPPTYQWPAQYQA